MSGPDGRWKQFETTCSLISAPQWHRIPCSGPRYPLVWASGLVVPGEVVLAELA